MNSDEDARAALHRTLWRDTLGNALRTKLYQDFWHDTDVASAIEAGPEGACLLPIIDKGSIQEAGEAARNAVGQSCIETISSGTTGQPFVTRRGNAELGFITAFYDKVFAATRNERALRKRVLAFDRLYHGSGVPIPCDDHIHKVSIYDYNAFDYAFDTLGRAHIDRGVEDWCTILMGTERIIAALLDGAEGRPPLSSRLEMVLTSGGYVSRRMRERVAQTFQAPVIDRYSMSEIFGGATESAITGWYRFDPCLLPEVVNPVTLAPISNGTGLLLLTALYPFQIVQPMVRYNTGDIVEVMSEPTGELLIKPKGRIRHSIVDPSDGEVLLDASTIYEAIDPEPSIARAPLFLDSGSVKNKHSCGMPRYKATSKNHENLLHILIVAETRGLQEALSSRIKSDILENSPRLQQAIEIGRAKFEVKISSGVTHPDFMWA